MYRELDSWTDSDWAKLLRKYVLDRPINARSKSDPAGFRFFVDAPALTVVGKPSSSLADKIKEDAVALIERNKQINGPEGLEKLQKEIEEAQAKNDVPVPNEIIRQFPIPDVDGIEWIKVETARSAGVAKDDSLQNQVQAHVDADGSELPLFVQFDREFGTGRG